MEVYGVKPKKFTKEWWGYFWYYYKGHTLLGLLAAVLIGVTAVQCATQPKYDLNIDFVSEFGAPMQYQPMLEELAETVIADVDENGETSASVLLIDLREDSDPMTIQARHTKFAVEQAYPTAYVFIVSETYAKQSVVNGILESSDVWAGDKATDEPIVSLADSEVLKNLGIDAAAAKLYVGVTRLSEKNAENPLEVAKYENGVRFARHLIGLE